MITAAPPRRKIYLTCFYSNLVSGNAPMAFKYIQDSAKYKEWCSYLPSSMFIFTEKSSYEISQDLITFLKEESFVVVQIDPSTLTGWLPAAAWDWLRACRNVMQHDALVDMGLHLPAPDSGAFGGLPKL